MSNSINTCSDYQSVASTVTENDCLNNNLLISAPTKYSVKLVSASHHFDMAYP